MSIVVEVIAEHLLSNRRLVVPAFGAFMVKESGERLFSDLLRTDDGVLASLLRERGLNEMEAAVTIDRFIFEVRHELEQCGYCRLGDVGTLRVEPETGAFRLYPSVYGEAWPTPTTAASEPIVAEEPVVEPELEMVEPEVEEPEVEEPESEVAYEPEVQEVPEEELEPEVQPMPKPKRKAKKGSRKGVDWVIVLAVIALAVALAGVAYGWYVSTLDYTDMSVEDETVSSLQILPNNDLEKE